MTLRDVFGVDDQVALCIALLHDTIEDTATGYNDLAEEFGAEVANGVAQLTRDERMSEEQREQAYHEQLAKASRRALLVKLADAYDNLCDTETSRVQTKSLAKAERLVDLVKDDPTLAAARELVEALIDELQSKTQ